MTAPVFELKRVTHKFGQFLALIDINLQIYPGERVALVGTSGAGKSTLLRLLNGTLFPTEGEVWVLGHNLSLLPPRRLRQVQSHIGTVYQQLHLVESLSVIHNVNAGHLGKWPFWKAALSLIHPLEVEKALQALQRVGIADKLSERTERLSGGQQQRVALARTLVQDPVAILADEPISSLDPELSREVMDLLEQLGVKQGKTLAISLHSPEFAMKHCDRLIGLRQGRVAFDLPPPEISESRIEELYRIEF